MLAFKAHQRKRLCDIAGLAEEAPDGMVYDRLLEMGEVHDRRAFVTGSYAYGKPRGSSDIDLVVYVSKDDFERLKGVADDYDESYPGYSPRRRQVNNPPPSQRESISLRFGGLNLLCVLTDDWYEAWQAGTEQLQCEAFVSKEGHVTRPRAVEVFTQIFKERGLQDE